MMCCSNQIQNLVESLSGSAHKRCGIVACDFHEAYSAAAEVAAFAQNIAMPQARSEALRASPIIRHAQPVSIRQQT